MIRVNGELIDPNLIEEVFARLKSEAEERTQAICSERDPEFTQAAEEEVIDLILIAQAAGKNSGKLDEAQVDVRLQELTLRLLGEGTPSDILAAAEPQLREEVSANLRMEQFVAKNLPAVAEPSDGAIAKYYQSRRSDYRTMPEVRALHLVKMIDEHNDHKALLETMTALRRRILAGEDFSKSPSPKRKRAAGRPIWGGSRLTAP